MYWARFRIILPVLANHDYRQGIYCCGNVARDNTTFRCRIINYVLLVTVDLERKIHSPQMALSLRHLMWYESLTEVISWQYVPLTPVVAVFCSEKQGSKPEES